VPSHHLLVITHALYRWKENQSPSRGRLARRHARALVMWTISPCCAEKNPGRPHARASAVRCAQVRSYKYTSPNDTICEAAFLHPMWRDLLVPMCPRWLAPNLITFAGLICAVIAYAMMMHHSPDLNGDAEPWVYVACVVLLFIYQTCDGMDGHQARRTGGGSPLGEVVDHGADALVSCIYGVFLCDTFGASWTENRLFVIGMITTSRLTFMIDTVMCTYTGVRDVAPLDAQELQMMTQLGMLWNVCYGNALWRLPVNIAGVQLGALGQLILFVGGSIGYVARIQTLAKSVNAPPSPHLPASRRPGKMYGTMFVFEIILTYCIVTCQNLPWAHAVSTVAFGDAMVRLMHLRVSDPETAPLWGRWSAILALSASLLPSTGDRASMIGLAMVTAGVVAYVAQFAALAAQITGCLGLHPNIFKLKKKTAAGGDDDAKKNAPAASTRAKKKDA